MNYSRKFIYCCLVLACGCSSSPPAIIEDSMLAHSAVAELAQREGKLVDDFTSAYFDYLLRRLIAALPAGSPEIRHLEVVVLAQVPQQAGTPGSGYIILSKPLIASLANEGQLAFVVAHELAHLVLGHTPQSGLSESARGDLEIDADSFAVGLIALAGYDPRVATGALTRAAPYGALFNFGLSASGSYPALDERVQKVQRMVADSNWRPPGTVDRRDFQLMRRQVMLAEPIHQSLMPR